MWFAHLKDIPQERIERVAVLMVDKYPSFPPTIGEFKEMIREEYPPKQYFAASHGIPYIENKTVGNKALEMLRKLTGAKKMPQRNESGEMDEKAIIARKKVLAEQAEQFEREHQGEFLP